MEETQAIDFADFPVEDDYTQAAGVGTDQVAGDLKLTSEPANKLLLYLGLNVVGRGSSSQADHDGMLDKWKTTYPGTPVHDLESGGAVCFIKDLGSRNKTMLGRAGGLTVLQANGDRYSVLQGDKLRFGTVDTVIQYSTEHAQATAGSHAQAAALQDGIQQTTGHQGNLDRSPTPEMANANPPSAPLPNTDNDMTLPWDDPPDHQQDYASMHETDGGRRPSAVNHDTQAFEPMFAETQLQAPSTDLLPETQVNEIPSAMPPASLLGSHQQAAKLGSASKPSQERQTATDNPGFPSLASGLPHVPVAEPTQLVGEPTQLALQLGSKANSSGPLGTSSSPQKGTALASAAAQAMTGAQPTQASVLPSSAGLPTGMPSLAPETVPSQPAVAGTSATGANGSQAVAGASLGPGNLPVTRPQADAVLHLPSQPSGSQHAAHPHGPPRHTEAATAEAPSAAPGPAQPTGRSSQALQPPQGPGATADGSASQQKHAQQQQLPAAEPEVGGHGSADDASAEGSGHNTLLDSVLGHDEDDSIWMPPASMPDSEVPSQEAAVLPAAGGQDVPLQSAAAPLPDARQPSDSDETQDSQPRAQEEVQQPGIAEPAEVAGPVRQGRRGRGAAPGDMGMYTGAFAFPDSASLEISQPAIELPIPRRSNTSAATAAKRGPPAKTASDSETVAKAAAASGKSVVLPQQEATDKTAEPANSRGKAVGRVVPSAWKVKKAPPVVDQPMQTTKTGSPPDKIAEAASDVSKPSRQLLKPVVHEPDKQSPWRTRGTPLGGGPGPSQLPDSEDVSAAMAAAGQMAAFFPSTQAEPDTDGQGPVPSPPSAVQADVARTSHQDSKCSQDSGARLSGEKAQGTAAAVENNAAGAEEEGQLAAAAQPHKVDKADAGVSGKRRKAAAAAHAAQKETDKAVIQSSKGQEEHKTKASNSGKLPEEEEEKAPQAVGRARKKGVSNRSAGFEDEEQGTSKAGRGRGRGRRSVGPGGRGRKGSNHGAAAKGPQTAAVEHNVVDMDVDTDQSKAAAVKSKRQRGASREGSPGVPATRVSKRQKAKADAQAAEAADLEQAEDEVAANEDPFSGAATQAAAGALEELRRSATPDEDPEDEEAEAAVPMLMPTKKGRRGRQARPAAASTSSGAAAVAAAEALVEGAAGAAPHPAAQSVTGQAKRRASGKGKAAGSSAKVDVVERAKSIGGGAEPSTASAQSQAADCSASATAGDDLQSSQGRASQQTAAQQTQGGSGSRARGRSRLSKASSSQAEPPAVETDAGPLPVTHRASHRVPEAVPAVTRKRRSGTASSGAQADARPAKASADVQPQLNASSAEEAGAHTGSEAAAEGAGTAAKGGRAKQKSVPVTAPVGVPAAAGAGASGRRGSRGGAASQGLDTAPAADTPAAAPASRAKRGRASISALPDANPMATAAAEEKEESDQPGPSSRGEGTGATNEAAGHGPAKRSSGAKANSRKRSRQDEASLADEGPASHVKAARKASDNKQVRVLYSTTLDKSKKASMTRVVKRLGGCVEDKEGPDFTHFVTLHPTAPGQTDRGFKKSINALIALAAGRPIVSDSWIDACGRSGSFVDPVDHLLIDTAAQKKFGFDMRTSYERAQHQLLLTGLHVFFTPGMLAAESDKGSNIKSLVGHAGGVVEHQLPRSVSGDDAEVSAQWLLIANEKNVKTEQKWGSSSKVGPGLSFHGRTVLIDSIMQQSLDRKHGVLFTT